MIEQAKMEDSVVFSLHAEGEAIATLNMDGTIEVSDKYTEQDAARVFWQAVMDFNPIQDVYEERERLREENYNLRTELGRYQTEEHLRRDITDKELDAWQSTRKRRRERGTL